MIDMEPNSFEDACRNDIWQEAMQDEIDSIQKNQVWDLVDPPEGKKVIGSKWLYKINHNATRKVEKYKAKFVAKGFSQKLGIDFDETFAPIARYTTIRIVLELDSFHRWNLVQMNVCTAFLNGTIEEEVYIKQPPGFVAIRSKDKVCRLKKALYGLKQAPRAWYLRIDAYLAKGITKTQTDLNLYYMVHDGILLIVFYVDDLIIIGNNSKLIDWMKVKYTHEILKRFNMTDCKPISTPMETNNKLLLDDGSNLVDATLYRQLVGSLMYLCNTRLNISYSIRVLN
eukprot:Gb_12566 [translate_table: standard]